MKWLKYTEEPCSHYTDFFVVAEQSQMYLIELTPDMFN